MYTWLFFLAITEDPAPPCSLENPIADVAVTGKAATANGALAYEMVDSIQSNESDYDQVDGNDVIQQARQYQNQNACYKRNNWRQMFGGERHEDLLGING